jgi:hypothetical protein
MTTEQYTNFCNLLSTFSAKSAALKTSEAAIELAHVNAADSLQPEFARAKTELASDEEKLKEMCVKFSAELFPDGKCSHATPFGTVKLTTSTGLDFTDEEKLLLLIRVRCLEDAVSKTPRGFNIEQLIRTQEAPNLEALERLDDATLSLFGITRRTTKSLKIVPVTVKADKPAKSSSKKGKGAE